MPPSPRNPRIKSGESEERLFALDPSLRISAFVKLKLTKCAPISGLPEIGFFVRKSGKPDLRPGDRAGHFVWQWDRSRFRRWVLTKQHGLQPCGRCMAPAPF
jgi:hypothetical protein